MCGCEHISFRYYCNVIYKIEKKIEDERRDPCDDMREVESLYAETERERERESVRVGKRVKKKNEGDREGRKSTRGERRFYSFLYLFLIFASEPALSCRK